MKVAIDSVQSSPYQPRLVFHQDYLKREIEKDGLLCNLVVRKQGDSYELIDGERRWRVLKELGWENVPVSVVEADDTMARLSVYKLNKIRENYSIEEEAKYFKKLAAESMTPLEISKQLTVDFHWVLANLNVFKFPDDIQEAVWTRQLSISHVKALESVIGRNIKEAVLTAKEILKRKLTISETRKTVEKRNRELKARVDEMRLTETEKVLPVIAPGIPKLETPEDFEKAAKVLRDRATKLRKGDLTSEEIKKATWCLKERRVQKDAMQEGVGQVSMQTVGNLQEKIEMLEKEKQSLLEKKSFLTDALSFNCPHCNHSCVVYRESGSYWVE